MMTILVTGGAGYIGSHTCIELLKAGYEVIILDNFYNSKREVLRRIGELSGKEFGFMSAIFVTAPGSTASSRKRRSTRVIHFAGLKAVGESCVKPLEYYENNVGGTVTLCEAMRDAGVKKMVFSSSATVYGMNNPSPLREDMPAGGTTNPYGTTKLMIEQILQDLYQSDHEWSITLLRYFNPIGAHKSGRIGEDPNGVPNNLMPYITQVAIGKRPQLQVYGDDYDTPDGTGVRDYIHVVDLALGHVKAVEKCAKKNGVDIYNLGTGVGYSVLDVVHAFEKASGEKIPYQVTDRRPGDIATCYSDPSKAAKELGWKAERGIEEMCEDSWRWQKQNPNGYPDEA